MTTWSRDVVATPSPSSPLLAGLLVLFVGSGLAGLVYEIVWFQLLELVIGSTAVSLGFLLGTFMGGLCVGSLTLPRLVSARYHPLRVYALLELGIGLMGLAVLFAMPLVDRLYAASGAYGFVGLLLRGCICAAFLLPPTVLMGATLPAAAQWIESTPRGVAWLGFLYGGNTMGAVIGCLLAGFYLLRLYDTTIATYVAAAINLTVAAVACILAARTSANTAMEQLRHTRPGATSEPGTWAVYITIALSGACALGAQVVWTRLLSLMFGGSTYTFSIILAVFLIGLAIGSGAGAWLAHGRTQPRLVLGCCQLLQTLGVVWAACMIASVLSSWPIDPALAPHAVFTMHLDLTRCAWAVLPGAVLWGASFSLALAAAAGREGDTARLVSRVYVANTVGAIVGALAFSLVLIPWVGTYTSQQALIALAALSAVVMFVLLVRSSSVASRRLGGGALGVSLALGVWLIFSIPTVPGFLVAFGRYMATVPRHAVELLYVGEGSTSSPPIPSTRG